MPSGGPFATISSFDTSLRDGTRLNKCTAHLKIDDDSTSLRFLQHHEIKPGEH